MYGSVLHGSKQEAGVSSTQFFPLLFSMKILSLVPRILLGLLLIMPVAGAVGFFPPPTEEMFT